MQIAFRSIQDTSLYGSDGTVGKIKDVLIDGDHWTVRYLVVDTGSWWTGRKVLLSPSVIKNPEWGSGMATVQLSQQQVMNSPDVDASKPVSRHMEQDLAAHYQWPAYWGSAVAGPIIPAPAHVSTDETSADQNQADQNKQDEPQQPNLRSAAEIQGYHIKATDGEIGHIEQLIIDDEVWTVRYVVVDTKNWIPGRRVLISPTWIQEISWNDRSVRVGATREAIENSPEFNPSEPVNRRYEEHLYDYYGREPYWTK